MKQNFEKCLEMLLHHEGGYVNHPNDPGGETNLGVTKKVYEQWCMKNDIVQKDMKDLEVSDVEQIYKERYWDVICGDTLPSGLDWVIFDFAVNAGPSRAVKTLQQFIATTVDGHGTKYYCTDYVISSWIKRCDRNLYCTEKCILQKV